MDTLYTFWDDITQSKKKCTLFGPCELSNSGLGFRVSGFRGLGFQGLGLEALRNQGSGGLLEQAESFG